MKRKSVHITIPQPCHESWDKMDATERGAFCHNCRKEVIDFSAMTDREVIEFLAKHKTGCGRFRKDQVDTNLTMTVVDNGFFKWRALALAALSVISFKSLFASSPKNFQTHYIKSGNRKDQKDTSAVKDDNPIVSVKGQVLDEKGEPLSFANVVLVDSPLISSPIIGIMTDTKGNFHLSYDKSKLKTSHPYLSVSYIGYERKKVALSDQNSQYYTVKFDKSDGVVIMGIMAPSPHQKAKRFFHRLFHKPLHHHQ